MYFIDVLRDISKAELNWTEHILASENNESRLPFISSVSGRAPSTHDTFSLLPGNSKNRNVHRRQSRQEKRKTRAAAIVWSSESALSL